MKNRALIAPGTAVKIPNWAIDLVKDMTKVRKYADRCNDLGIFRKNHYICHVFIVFIA